MITRRLVLVDQRLDSLSGRIVNRDIHMHTLRHAVLDPRQLAERIGSILAKEYMIRDHSNQVILADTGNSEFIVTGQRVLTSVHQPRRILTEQIELDQRVTRITRYRVVVGVTGYTVTGDIRE